jgi:hypothetical protein
MASKKGSKKAATPVVEQVETSTPVAVAVVEAPVSATPAQKRGTSTIGSPVAAVWVTCFNMCAAALAAGQPIPARKALLAASQAAGATFYTARTQVQAFLKASSNGTTVPTKAPRGVKFTSAE